MERSPKLTPRESARNGAHARWGPAPGANFGDLSASLRRVVLAALAAVREAEAAADPRAAA